MEFIRSSEHEYLTLQQITFQSSSNSELRKNRNWRFIRPRERLSESFSLRETSEISNK